MNRAEPKTPMKPFHLFFFLAAAGRIATWLRPISFRS
jgi:hypothetical protein